MSSLARLIPTTFWMVTLSSASSRGVAMARPVVARRGASRRRHGRTRHGVSSRDPLGLNAFPAIPSSLEAAGQGGRRPHRWKVEDHREMQLSAAARSDLGRRRPANEDIYALAPELGLYLVADGMGGHRAGQVASGLAARAAVGTLRGLREGPPSAVEKLRACVTAANAEILASSRAKPELAGMGTT